MNKNCNGAQVIGDEIYFKGIKIAVINSDTSSLKDKFIEHVEGISREDAYEEGYDKGHTDGQNSADDRYDDGFEKGYNQGYEEGKSNDESK